MSRYLFIMIIIFLGIFAQGQSFSLKIIDDITSEDLIGANVQVDDRVIISDEKGELQFDTQENEIIVSYIGYEKLVYRLLAQKEIQIIRLVPIASLLETATISTSRHSVVLAETTVSLEVIKPQLIANNNLVSMDAVLGKVPGVQMVGGQANIRGGSGFSYGAGSRVMLLIDDLPALNMDSGFPNWNDVPLENVSQVEVLKGSASTLYGSAALNGIVNVRTAMPSSEPETKFSMAYTGFMSPKNSQSKWWDRMPFGVNANFVDKRKLGKFDMVWNANYYFLDSYNKDAGTNRGRIGFNTRYRLNDKWSITLNGLFNRSKITDFYLWKSQDETYEPLALLSASTANDNTRWQLDPGMQYLSEMGYKHYLKNRVASISNNSNNNQSNQSTSYYTEYQLHKKIEQLGLQTIVGGTYSSVTSTSALYDGKYRYSNYAAFVQLDKKLFEKLNLTIGTRYENNRLETLEQSIIKPSVGSEIVSRAGANYQVGKSSYLRASWGQGYRFPTIAERYIRTTIGSLVIFPNKSLKSEKGWSSEVGVKQGLKLGDITGYIDLAGFYQRYEDMIEFTFVGNGTEFGFLSLNVGNTIILGGELTMGAKTNIGNSQLNLLGGYTYLLPTYEDWSEDNNYGSSENINFLKYRSKHSFKLDVDMTTNKWNYGLSYQAISRLIAIDNALQDLPTMPDFAGIKAYREANKATKHIVNFRGSYSFNQFKVGLILANVFNEAYTLRPGLMEAPRNITLKFDYQF